MSSSLLPDLTVEGWVLPDAGPELLRDLLKQYEGVLRDRTPHLLDQIQPGLSADTIRRKLAALDIDPCPEALVWWGWRNGFPLGAGRQSGHSLGQISLEVAIGRYPRDILGPGTDEWSPEWIEINDNRIAVSNLPGENPPRVRRVDTWSEASTAPDDTAHEVLSLSTLVSMWLWCYEQGGFWVDSDTGAWFGWQRPTNSPLPPELNRLSLI